MNYYNEIDPGAAEWLENLIFVGEIPDGVVDRRSIEDVTPNDLKGFNQCHFFAGIGGWPLALRYAGVPDDFKLWTGSCPCQPFSQAGQGAGFADERHLWPAWHWLVQECRPAVILGEQVASRGAEPWLDLVSTDLEDLGYAFGAYAGPSAGVGAPHIRDRCYWGGVAYAHGGQCRGVADGQGCERDWTPPGRVESDGLVAAGGKLYGLAHPHGSSRGQRGSDIRGRIDGSHAQPWARLGGGSVPCNIGLADTNVLRLEQEAIAGLRHAERHAEPRGGVVGMDNSTGARHTGPVEDAEGQARHEARLRLSSAGLRQDQPGAASPLHGHWASADWLFCRDGKWRPVEPGSQPLAHGLPARVGRLRAYGNAINPHQGAAFVRAFLMSVK